MSNTSTEATLIVQENKNSNVATFETLATSRCLDLSASYEEQMSNAISLHQTKTTTLSLLAATKPRFANLRGIDITGSVNEIANR